MKQVLIYSLKVWLTTAIVTPPILILLTVLFYHEASGESFSDVAIFYLVTVLFGIVFTAIPYVILLYVLHRLTKRLWPVGRIKKALLICSEFVTGCLLIGWDVYKSNVDVNTLYLWLPYALVLGVCIWFYKLKPSPGSVAIDTL